MTSDVVQSKLLKSKQEILDYLGLSDDMFKKFVRSGMPVRYIGNKCIAHTENLDAFSRAFTRVSSKDIPEEVLDKK